MSDLLDRLRNGEPPSLEETRQWMKSWTTEMALRNYQIALDKVESGDERWGESLKEIGDFLRKKSILP